MRNFVLSFDLKILCSLRIASLGKASFDLIFGELAYSASRQDIYCIRFYLIDQKFVLLLVKWDSQPYLMIERNLRLSNLNSMPTLYVNYFYEYG